MKYHEIDLFAYMRKLDGSFDYSVPSRQEMGYQLSKEWEIKSPFREHLSNYYLLHYSGEQFKALNENGYLVHRDNLRYLIIFHRGTAEQMYEAPRLALSFRNARKEYRLLPYVLVHIAPLGSDKDWKKGIQK
jgi:hypothetical protein